MNRTDSRMKCIVAGMLMVVFLSAACFAGDKDKDPPKFFIQHQTVDVGEIYEGQDIAHVYNVRNNGIGELHIINVKPG